MAEEDDDISYMSSAPGTIFLNDILWFIERTLLSTSSANNFGGRNQGGTLNDLDKKKMAEKQRARTFVEVLFHVW